MGRLIAHWPLVVIAGIAMLYFLVSLVLWMDGVPWRRARKWPRELWIA